ncbi:hypothetical protein [Synechococcus elongatus]|uniref:hypothetical protein n=1 Tax=Synechococcus elongatus TaxID=32046 RepID=UPI0030D2B88C
MTRSIGLNPPHCNSDNLAAAGRNARTHLFKAVFARPRHQARSERPSGDRQNIGGSVGGRDHELASAQLLFIISTALD